MPLWNSEVGIQTARYTCARHGESGALRLVLTITEAGRPMGTTVVLPELLVDVARSVVALLKESPAWYYELRLMEGVEIRDGRRYWSQVWNRVGNNFHRWKYHDTLRRKPRWSRDTGRS